MDLDRGAMSFQACSLLVRFSVWLCGEVYASSQGEIPSMQEHCLLEGSKHTYDGISASCILL
jgi:hypothetical protein